MLKNTILGIKGFLNAEITLKSRGGLKPMRGYMNAKLIYATLKEIIA